MYESIKNESIKCVKEREMCCLLNHLETSYFEHMANNINDLCNEKINHQILEHLNI